jgi:hypothetical protein
MPEIEVNKLTSPSIEAAPPSEAEVGNTAQEIVDHLEGAGLESARWKAFADFADREEAIVLAQGDEGRNNIRLALIEETIRQRKNEVKGYKTEYGIFETVGKAYMTAMHEYVMKKYRYREHLKRTDMNKYKEYTKDEPFFRSNTLRQVLKD